MTSATERHALGSVPPGGHDRLRALAGELHLLGLDARALTVDGGLAGGGALAAELVVINPVRDRGQARVSGDGTITWTCLQALSSDGDAADVADAIRVVLTRPERGVADGNGARHVLTAACPLSCLASLISPMAYNAVGRALRLAGGGHPTVGHVVDLHRRRMLPGIRGLGAKGVCQIDCVLRLAGLPADPYDPVDLAVGDAAVRSPGLAPAGLTTGTRPG